MKQKVMTFFAYVSLITGLSLILYPSVSNYFKVLLQHRAIGQYLTSVEEIPEADYSQALGAAEAFNRKLTENRYLLMNLPDDLREEYYSVLDVDGDGVMGYISVPVADIMLPVYHGTSDPVLQAGAGHIEGSSFPVDGESVHAILSGHRGLPSALLFTNLDKLKAGDVFTMYVLNETFMYRVKQIEVVTPTDANSLFIETGKNLCTLMTCTPYGINTHRLLIHGEMMDAVEMEKELAAQPGAEGVPVSRIILVLEVPAVLTAVIIASRKTRKKR